MWYTCIHRNTMFKEVLNFIHLNLAFALLFALITFVGGIETAIDSEVRQAYVVIIRDGPMPIPVSVSVSVLIPVIIRSIDIA